MPRFSRRNFLHLSTAATAAAVFRFSGEAMLAAQARRQPGPDAVVIDSNENPLGPSAAAREAMAAILAHGGRYSDELTRELHRLAAQQLGLDAGFVQVTAGSTPPLCLGVMAFTSPQKSFVTADPSFEVGMFTAGHGGARVVKVPLTPAYAHDVRAMLSQAPDAGLFYICNPNNPTGTMTSHADIATLVDQKPKDAVVLVDEAYIHLTEAESALDLVKAGKDVVVLRTFSKVYGLAGLRCGLVIARPDLLDKIMNPGGFNFMPITAVVAATASLREVALVPERRRINASVRQQTFDWLGRNGFSFIPSQSNCFMLDAKRPGQAVRDAMAKENVFIGRVWPIMPTHVRITVGTEDEMRKFQTAWQKVMQA
jgi:histidinol-phosphate aminotransferase